MRVALCLLAALVVVPTARAGGDFVDVGAHGARVWFVGSFGVRELDARTGRSIAAPRLAGAAIPISIAFAGGAAWVASIENGYLAPKLTRIELRTGRRRVIWQRSVVEYVSAGAGGVYADLNNDQIALFSPAGRLIRTWDVPEAGRMAADASGCWVSLGRGALVHIDRRGRVHTVLHAQMGDVATAAGAAWLPQPTAILRVDERTGKVQTLHTNRLRLGGFQHDLAVGEGALWTLQQSTRYRSLLVKPSLGTGRVIRAVALPGISHAVQVTAGAVWVAVAPNKLVRIDPRTLRRTLTVSVL